MSPLKLWPKSLFGRHLLLMAGLILTAELLLAVGFHWLVQRPRLERAAALVQAEVQWFAGALAHMSVEERQRFAASLEHAPVVLRLMRQPPVAVHAPDTWTLRLAQRRLRDKLGQDVVMTQTDGVHPWVWLRLELDGEPWWLGLEARHLVIERGPLWLAVLLATAVLAFIGAWLIQRHLHRPLRQLQQAAQALAHGQYPQLCWPAQTPTEVQDLGQAFDHMARQLERNDQERALMLAGLSHDLRTPLAKLRLAVEILQVEGEEELLHGMVRNIEVADQIIGQFVDFARAESSEALVPCDLAELVQDVVSAGASRRLQCQPPGSPVPVILCQPLGLRRALGNLLDNALKYSTGPVWISWQSSGQEVEIVVQDEGPGIASEALARVTQPFVRLDAARGGPGGAGLGLAIVERVMRQMGGRLVLSSPAGLRATLRWPRLHP